MNAPLLEMRGIEKAFGPQTVLRQVDFDLRGGEVHVLAGENGAGKSTLIRILGGVHRADVGAIVIDGQSVHWRHPRDAAAHGIAIIHQELSLVPAMSIADNLFLGHERSRFSWLDRSEMRRQSASLLTRVGMHVDPDRLVGELPISARQLVEIAKGLALDARIIVMDEPTSALNQPEVEHLFARIDDLKSQGCGIIYITHRLDEIYRVADRISVLRDGQMVATRARSELPAAELVKLMVGRTLSDQAPPRAASVGPVALEVAHCTVRSTRGSRGAGPIVDDVSFTLHKGEILGLVGLEGSGASELLWSIFGADGRRSNVQIKLNGRSATIRHPRDAIERGIGLVTNDRKRTGLVPGMDIVQNTTLPALPGLSPLGWLDGARELDSTETIAGQLNLAAASLRQSATTLSGGNQQKVVLGKWMATDSRILLLDEPTRGVDVGAKHEIYLLMNRWSQEGRSMVIRSSELPELLQVSDRIIVMHRGRIVATFEGHGATAADLLRAAMGFN